MKQQTFKQLGIPFPLFEAPIGESQYQGEGRCDSCGEHKPHCFQVDSITNTRPFGIACYECIRAERATFVHDTEVGKVGLGDARIGLTQGLPASLVPDEEYDTQPRPAPADDEDEPTEEWVQYQAEPQHLLELVKTPNYITWQGDNWLFHHHQPMIYVGVWGELPFDDPPGELREICEPIREAHDEVTIYVFRCQECETYKVHYDFT